jgi:nucleoside triphosphate diphosphatase
LQVLFYAEMAQEAGYFGIDDVIERLSTKLVNRHPHVFGDVEAKTSGDVLRNWEALKAQEKKKRIEGGPPKPGVGLGGEDPESVLAGVSRNVPALLEAFKISSRAAHVGFEWPEIQGLFDKLHEETEELRENLKEYPAPGPRPPQRGVAGSQGFTVPEDLRDRLEDEVGDLFFVLVNIARYLSLDPESALRKTNRKFRRRFQWMEDRFRERGRSLPQATLDEMESLWQESKQQEK